MLTLLAQGSTLVDIGAQKSLISPITDIGSLIGIGAGAILTLGGFALLGYLLLGGFHWITAGGDKGKVEAAREMITQGIIGLAVLASVFAIYGVVLRFLGIKSIQIGSGKSSISAPAGGSTSSTCPTGQVNDGGSGGYCNGGAACVVWVGAGVGPSKFNYAHYEPVSCLSGSRNNSYTFYNP